MCKDCEGRKELVIDGVKVDCPCQDAAWRALGKKLLDDDEAANDEAVNEHQKKAGEGL